jgi:hypothetical protein
MRQNNFFFAVHKLPDAAFISNSRAKSITTPDRLFNDLLNLLVLYSKTLRGVGSAGAEEQI